MVQEIQCGNLKYENMKVPKLFTEIILSAIFLVMLSLTLVFFYNFNDSFLFYKNLKTILLCLLIAGVLIGNTFKANLKSELILKIFSSPLSTLILIFLIICFLALFINRLIYTGFVSGEMIYHQISAIILGLISLGLFIYLHVNNVKSKSNVA